jgi:hypothetical protein
MSGELTRRQLLRAGVAAGAAVGTGGSLFDSVVQSALAAAPSCGSLSDIEHVVILIQENRSFDHYFGSYRGVTGFADPRALKLTDGSGLTVFAQPGYPSGFDREHLCGGGRSKEWSADDGLLHAPRPLLLATESDTTLSALEQTVAPPYPVTVNSAAPPQEQGRAPAPSGPVACRV